MGTSERFYECRRNSTLYLMIDVKKIGLKGSRVGGKLKKQKKNLKKYNRNRVQCLTIPMTNEWIRRTAIEPSSIQVNRFLCTIYDLIATPKAYLRESSNS